MESKSIYSVNGIVIRDGCFSPAKEWLQPTSAEITQMFQICQLSDAKAAEFFGIESRTVRRWKSGEALIPYAVWAKLAELAGYGDIYK